jgi:hypothetical protein
MVEPLTNAILASILHLIRRDLTENQRAALRRAPPHWVPPCRALARRWHRCPHRSGPRVTTPPPQYQTMEPSPPRAPEQSLPRPPLPLFGVPYTPRSQVDLRWLARPPEGVTIFMVATPRRTLATEEEEMGSPAVEPLTRGTTDLTISDQLTLTLTLMGWSPVHHHGSHH